MKKCRNCGFNNLDGRDLCFKCGGALEHRADFEPRRRMERLPRIDVAGMLAQRLSRAGRRMARAFEVDLPEGVSHRFPFLAGFLALAPGLGQIYNRQLKKVLYFAPPFVAALVLAVCFITTPYWGNAFIALAVAIPLLSFSDAMATAARINGQQFTLRGRLALMTYPAFLLGFIGFGLALMTYFNWPLLSLFYVSADYMEPALRKGDRICGESLSLWFRGARPGDIVRYDPPLFKISAGLGIEGGGADYLVDAQNGWERVMAVGGETLECIDDVFYVNGRRLSPEYYPLLPGNLPHRFRIECPPGKYLIVISARAENTGIMGRLESAQVPFLGGKSWEEACLVGREAIWDRSRFIYWPALRRRFLTPKGPRFADE